MKSDSRIIITVTPTNKTDEDGYKTGIVTLYKDDGPGTKRIELDHWECDSYSLEGDICGDFECDGGLRFWYYSEQLKVIPGYFTRIIGPGSSMYQHYSDVLDLWKNIQNK